MFGSQMDVKITRFNIKKDSINKFLMAQFSEENHTQIHTLLAKPLIGFIYH